MVIAPFVDAYRAGHTPVPCVQCNKELKFGSLLNRARAWMLLVSPLATMHA